MTDKSTTSQANTNKAKRKRRRRRKLKTVKARKPAPKEQVKQSRIPRNTTVDVQIRKGQVILCINPPARRCGFSAVDARALARTIRAEAIELQFQQKKSAEVAAIAAKVVAAAKAEEAVEPPAKS